ncbi:MAG: hypothetical protein N2C14_27230 [Planctomycetales bacterium]
MKDPDSEFVWSLFGALGHLCEDEDLPDYDKQRLKELDQWFDANLKEPNRLARSRRYNAEKKAVCWFKASAISCIDRLREIAAILEIHGIPVRMIKTTNPGYIVYEDSQQVAAEPFRDHR